MTVFGWVDNERRRWLREAGLAGEGDFAEGG